MKEIKENNINGALLRTARKEAGLTALEVANALGFSTHKTIIDIETGKRPISNEELNHLFSLYNTTKDQILSHKKNDDWFLPFFRANESPLITTIKDFMLELKPKIELYYMLMKSLGLDKKTYTKFWQKYNLPSPKNQEEALEQGDFLAENLRASLELGDDPVNNIYYVVERLGIQLFTEDFGEEYKDNLSGFFINAYNNLPLIFINKTQKPQRRIFSVAHEICHFLVDSDPNLRWFDITHTVNPLKERYLKDYREVRANRFAASFLMPETGLKRYIQQVLNKEWKDIDFYDIIKIHFCYKVSFSSALYRLLSLNIVTSPQFEKLKTYYSSNVININETAKILGYKKEEEYPEVIENFDKNLKAIAVQAYKQSKISIGKLCEIFEYPVADQRLLLKTLGIGKNKIRIKNKNPLLK